MAHDRTVAEGLPDVSAARLHPAIATVCLSGTLEDKLAAIWALRGHALTPEQVAGLRKRIGDRSNLVVAAATTALLRLV